MSSQTASPGNYDHDGGSWGTHHYREFPTEMFFYPALAVIFLMIVALMMKLLWTWEGDDGSRDGTRPTERSRLMPSKEEVLFIFYGTSEEDIESGKGSCSSSSDDLYDGKICVICYDDQRSCFFMPCGHYITCHNCAKRIVSEENKSCPICRSLISKVRVLHIL